MILAVVGKSYEETRIKNSVNENFSEAKANADVEGRKMNLYDVGKNIQLRLHGPDQAHVLNRNANTFQLTDRILKLLGNLNFIFLFLKGHYLFFRILGPI